MCLELSFKLVPTIVALKRFFLDNICGNNYLFLEPLRLLYCLLVNFHSGRRSRARHKYLLALNGQNIFFKDDVLMKRCQWQQIRLCAVFHTILAERCQEKQLVRVDYNLLQSKLKPFHVLHK